MITVGIDVGSITTKAVVMDHGELKWSRVDFTGYDARSAAQKIFGKILSEADIGQDDVRAIVSTGYGRNSVTFATRAITEITCHAVGACFINPGVKSIIDIGGQDSKAIVLDNQDKVKDFAMNDKCAAGTGRFLEVMARALEVDLNQFGELSLTSGLPSPISSLCTVFAESEVISLISKGEKRENIIAGIHESIGARIVAMASRIHICPPVMMTGGGAKNIGLVKAIEKKVGSRIAVFDTAQITGAIGAALMGLKEM